MDWLMTEDEILEHFDEFTLYCYYLGFEPELRVKYQSPIRTDENPDVSPSFSIFENRYVNILREYVWKDSGGQGKGGDIFSLVQHKYHYKTRREAVERVRRDFIFNHKGDALEKVVPIPKEPADIRVKTRDFNEVEKSFWNSFGINLIQLYKYKVRSLQYYWYLQSQVKPSFISNMGFCYSIYDKYQLYFPLQKPEFKFRNDMTERYVPGMQQLKYDQPTLIITKSYKDVMLLDRFGNDLYYEVITVRSENTPIPDDIQQFLRGRYRRIVTLFDNDGKHRRDFVSVADAHYEMPKDMGQKDPSDFRRMYGDQELVRVLTSFLC